MIVIKPVRDILRGDRPEGKSLDTEEYGKALQESGYTHEQAKEYWANVANSDPYAQAGKEITKAVDAQAPKVAISGNKISISAPKSVLESPYVSQLKSELQTLKGVDLTNQEVRNAIDSLNEEIRTNFSNSMIGQTLGWTPDEYKDYQYALQTVGGTNPMASKNYLKWGPDGEPLKDDDGKIMMKTPQEWVDYWRSHYSADERSDLLRKSAQSNKPYERTMALVLMQGQDRPIYGFSTGEKLGQLGAAAWNEIKKLPEGLVRLAGTDSRTKKLESLSEKLFISSDDLKNPDIANETQFNEKKESIAGKKWDDLSKEDKAFVLLAAVSRTDSRMLDSAKSAADADIDSMYRADASVSAEAIKRIMNGATFDRYKQTRNDYRTWQGYDAQTSSDDERLAKNAYWSAAEQTIGTMGGVLGRYLWEAALMKAATGGINKASIANPKLVTGKAAKALSGGVNVNAISDKIGARIISGLSKAGISPASNGGQAILLTAANLIGTIPEDLLQDSIDNVLTYNAKENANLLSPEKMSEDFKRKLIFIAFVNAGKAGYNAVKRARLAKKLKAVEDLDRVVDIDGIVSDADDIARAVKSSDQIKIEDGTVSIIDTDGKEKILKNTTPEQAEMVQMSLFDQETPPMVKRDASGVDGISGEIRRGFSSEQPYKGGMDANFYSFVETSSPIDGVRSEQGSLTRWLGERDLADDGATDVAHPDMNPQDAYTLKKIESLPQEIQDAIKNDKNIQALINRYGYNVAFRRLGQDFPASELLLDGKYANYLWRQLKNADTQVEVAKGQDAVGNVSSPAIKAEVGDIEAGMYKPRDLADALRAKFTATADNVRKWHASTLEMLTGDLGKHLDEFHDKFGDVRASDFDWVWYQTKQGMTPQRIIGTTDPTTGRVVTKNMIDAMQWWSKQPFVKDLRKASRDALGYTGDFDTLGYLPHTDYDPANLSFEETLTGALWQKATGTSVLGDNNLYKGFGGDFDSRYRTFASNMLWDSRNTDVATAKLVDEAVMDGQELTPELVENSRKAVEGEKVIRGKVAGTPSSKALVGALSSDADDVDWDKISKNVEKQARDSGLGKAYHDNYADVYYGANSAKITHQNNGLVNSFDTLGNRMRNTVVGNGMSMYDWGGADIVYSAKNAIDIVNRFTREGGDLREMLLEYVQNHSHRSEKYADQVVDKWMARIGEIKGPRTKGKVISELSKAMYGEAMGRLKKWLVMSDYDSFNSSTKKMIDQFLFDHVQMDEIKANPTIMGKLSKGLDAVASLRYRSIFYGNIKNALLQTSELNRYFSSFKWGDVATMAKRLATDEDFRAKVDSYVQSIAPDTGELDADLYGKYSNVADNMEVGETGVTFKDLGKKAKETADAIGLAPIEAAEAFKNRMMVAGLVQEADRLGLTGDDALRHIRQRFERVALAADEMGRIGLASNPLARPMLFLQNFQIRELGMHLYNIMDATGMAKSTPKKIVNAVAYLSKVFGAKMATTLVLARLGYSASQTLGIDPFGVLDSYTKMDEDRMNAIDKQISGGILTPFFSGGMTSLIADMYFMARDAYEDSIRQSVSDEGEANLGETYGMDWSAPLSLDNLLNMGAGFVPGNTAFNRINQMNEMMDSGWATSASGNKMYTAPGNPWDMAMGYLFGRSATPNAQRYNQTYGDNLGQTLSRFNPLREYGEFDPIDAKNYTDWFDGSDNDAQQFNKGLRYFRNERDRILDAYEQAVRGSYASSDEKAGAKNDMNIRLEELFDKLDRFVDAYEKKNGAISSTMAKQVVNVLNTGRDMVGDTESEAESRGQEEYEKALGRYARLGITPVGTYTGPTASSPDKEVKYQGSPQFRSSVSGYYDAATEAVNVLKQADADLQSYRKELKSALNAAYDAKDYDEVAAIQNEYLKRFDQVVSPVIAMYGNSILASTDVTNQLKDMLSTGTNSRSGDLIPTDQYKKDKYGRYRSMPLETVDVKKWAQQRFDSSLYKNPTSSSQSSAQDDIAEIKRLASQGKRGRARAKALQLKVRVEAQERALSQDDYAWLIEYIKNGGE